MRSKLEKKTGPIRFSEVILALLDSPVSVCVFPLTRRKANAIRPLFLSSVVNHRVYAAHPSQSDWPRPVRCHHLWLARAASTLGGADLEAVLEAAGDGGEGSHAAGTGGLSALGLLGPVVCFVDARVSSLVVIQCLYHMNPNARFLAPVKGHPMVCLVDSYVHVHFRVLAAG